MGCVDFRDNFLLINLQPLSTPYFDDVLLDVLKKHQLAQNVLMERSVNYHRFPAILANSQAAWLLLQ